MRQRLNFSHTLNYFINVLHCWQHDTHTHTQHMIFKSQQRLIHLCLVKVSCHFLQKDPFVIALIFYITIKLLLSRVRKVLSLVVFFFFLPTITTLFTFHRTLHCQELTSLLNVASFIYTCASVPTHTLWQLPMHFSRVQRGLLSHLLQFREKLKLFFTPHASFIFILFNILQWQQLLSFFAEITHRVSFKITINYYYSLEELLNCTHAQ